LSLPSEEAARLALRTQQVIARESGVPDTADPLGGSPFIEELTDQIDGAASDIIQEIDERGGMLRSIEDGFVRNAIEQSAYEAQVARDSGETLPVGSEEGGEIPEAPFHVDPVVEQQRIERLVQFRANRNPRSVESAMTQLEEDAQGSVNLMPSLIHAMESGCTLGEVSSMLASVFGEYQDHG
jgi:methylmalonyl-CoA mutase N-terminal domain/subunit